MDNKLRSAIDDLVNRFHIGDFIYNIRERVNGEDTWWKANPALSSWEHPNVKRYGECVEILRLAALDQKDSGK